MNAAVAAMTAPAPSIRCRATGLMYVATWSIPMVTSGAGVDGLQRAFGRERGFTPFSFDRGESMIDHRPMPGVLYTYDLVE